MLSLRIFPDGIETVLAYPWSKLSYVSLARFNKELNIQ
jgi:hypothetical protein